MPTKKNADAKRFNLLNETISFSNIVLSDLNIIYTHCTCVHEIIIRPVIIDVFQYVLIVEHVGYAIQTKK